MAERLTAEGVAVRVTLFWDFSNFDISLRRLEPRFPRAVRFDYSKFVKEVVGPQDLIKVYFACSRAGAGDESLRTFFHWLDEQPFFLVKAFERSRRPGDGVVTEKQVDVYLATQMVALAYEDAYDIAVLVSGDSDFLPAVDLVQQKGKIVSVVSSRASLSDQLRVRADRFHLIDEAGALHFSQFLSSGAAG